MCTYPAVKMYKMRSLNCVKMPKIALINGISMSIFKFYNFLPILCPFFYPFLAFIYIWGQISINCHVLIYRLC